MGPDPTAVLGDLEVAVRRGRDLLEALAGLRVDAADDDGNVVATADGFGRLVGLRWSAAALRYPQRLGSRVTAAVRRAREAAATAAEQHQAASYPELPSLADVGAAMSPAPERPDLQAADYPGSSRVRNAIAEGTEVRHRIERARRGFEDHQIHQEIGLGAGTVTVDGTGSRVTVEIRPEAVQRVGPQRLGDQIVAAVREAEERAEEYRMSTLSEIDLGGDTMGNLVRDAQRILDMTSDQQRGAR